MGLIKFQLPRETFVHQLNRKYRTGNCCRTFITGGLSLYEYNSWRLGGSSYIAVELYDSYAAVAMCVFYWRGKNAAKKLTAKVSTLL